MYYETNLGIFERPQMVKEEKKMLLEKLDKQQKRLRHNSLKTH